MKVISLTQPWSWLLLTPFKRIETRGWRLPDSLIGQTVAVHASKGFPKWARDLCFREPFRTCLRDTGINHPDELPTGVILGTVKLFGCMRTERIFGPNAERVDHTPIAATNLTDLSPYEEAFGDYSPGRYGFLSNYPVWLETPIPAKGQLGFWDFPSEIIANAPRRPMPGPVETALL